MSPAPELKAAGFNSQMEQLRGMVGATPFDSFLDSIPPELSDYVRRPRLATTWLPMSVNVEINDRILKTLLSGDLESMFELGRRQFKADLSTVYRMFVRLGSVSFIAKRAGALYLTYTRNAGTLTLVHEEKQLVELEVAGHPLGRPSLWAYMRGTVHGAAEVSGARGVKSLVVDGGATQSSCRVRITWG